MLLNETHLTFGGIADRWARETNDTRDEILLEMIRAVWRGKFEDDSPEPKSWLSINLPKTIRGDGVYLDEHDCRTNTPPRMAVNRRALLAAMPPIANVPLPPVRDLCPKSGNEPAWETIKTGIPWDSLLSLTLDEYGDMYRRVYLKGLIISKEDFGRWCDTRGDRRPAFWFGRTVARKILDEGEAASKRRDTVADGAVKDEPVAPEPAVGDPQQPRRKKPAKAMHDQQQKKAPRPRGRSGRKPGSGAYTDQDRVLWEKMKAELDQDKAVSSWKAAEQFVGEAPGHGTPDSKRRRLLKGYNSWITTQ